MEVCCERNFIGSACYYSQHPNEYMSSHHYLIHPSVSLILLLSHIYGKKQHRSFHHNGSKANFETTAAGKHT